MTPTTRDVLYVGGALVIIAAALLGSAGVLSPAVMVVVMVAGMVATLGATLWPKKE